MWFLFSGDSPLRQTELGGYGAGIIQVVAQWPSGHGHILGTWSVPVSVPVQAGLSFMAYETLKAQIAEDGDLGVHQRLRLGNWKWA